MSARRGLERVLRLARSDERRALQQLAAARMRSEALERRLGALDERRASARAGLAPGAGTRTLAAELQQHCAQLAAAEREARVAQPQLRSAQQQEEAARRALAERRLRVRVVAKALARRRLRERMRARRAEARRVDEAVRASAALGEATDARA